MGFIQLFIEMVIDGASMIGTLDLNAYSRTMPLMEFQLNKMDFVIFLQGKNRKVVRKNDAPQSFRFLGFL